MFLAVTLFSLLISPGGFHFVFRITMIFALPVACLYIPFAISLRDAEEGRIWTILGSGIVIGPASLAVWGTAHGSGWQSDDIGPGLGGGLLCALIVGSLTTLIYVIALKIAHWRVKPNVRRG